MSKDYSMDIGSSFKNLEQKVGKVAEEKATQVVVEKFNEVQKETDKASKNTNKNSSKEIMKEIQVYYDKLSASVNDLFKKALSSTNIKVDVNSKEIQKTLQGFVNECLDSVQVTLSQI